MALRPDERKLLGYAIIFVMIGIALLFAIPGLGVYLIAFSILATSLYFVIKWAVKAAIIESRPKVGQ
jgi:uncharacterized protein DUF6019